MTRFPRTVLLVLFFLLLAVGASTQATTVVPLNDTGQTLCYDGAGATVNCASSGEDDGRYGRDAANTAGQLIKTGAGSAGFDFSKIANDGSVLPASATLGSNPTEWACTRDNVTGLIWEVKTTSGLRNSNNQYSWYSTDSTSNGGYPGTANGGACVGSNCDTEAFVAAVNAAGLCGYHDWRLPSVRELQSLVDFSVPYPGSNPTIDANYFPNTKRNDFVSANSCATGANTVMYVKFLDGSGWDAGKYGGYSVRVVRGTQ